MVAVHSPSVFENLASNFKARILAFFFLSLYTIANLLQLQFLYYGFDTTYLPQLYDFFEAFKGSASIVGNFFSTNTSLLEKCHINTKQSNFLKLRCIILGIYILMLLYL